MSDIQMACREACDLNFGELECIDWKAVNVEDARGRLYDSDRALFGPVQGSIDDLIADAEKSMKASAVKDISKHFEEPSL